MYQVSLRWTANPNRAAAVPVEIVHPAGAASFLVNQQLNGGAWMPLLTTNFNPGSGPRHHSQRRYHRLCHRRRGAIPAFGYARGFGPGLASVATTSTAGGLPGRILFVRSGDTNTELSVSYTLSGTASNGADYAALPGTITFSAGASFTNVLVVPLTDALAEGAETVVLSLNDSADYSVGPLASATVSILDANPPQPAWLVLPSFQAGSWQFTFLGTPGTAYEVQRSASLPGSWTTLGAVTTGPDGSAQWMDTAPLTNGAFYRVVFP